MSGSDRQKRAKTDGPPSLPPRTFGGKAVADRSRRSPVEDPSRQWFGVIVGASGTLILICFAVGLYYLFREKPDGPARDVVDAESVHVAGSDAPSLDAEKSAEPVATPPAATPATGDGGDVIGRFFKNVVGNSVNIPPPPATLPQNHSVQQPPVAPVVVTNPAVPQTGTRPDSGPIPADPLPADFSESAIELPCATDYVDLPSLPAGPSAARDEVSLLDLTTWEKCRLRLLGLSEFTSDVAWESPEGDRQRINVTSKSPAGADDRELLGRVRIQDGKLVFRWTHQTGRLRSLQEFLRECVVEIRSEESEAVRYVALRRPTVGKAEGVERLLKDDRRIALGKALSGVARRRVFLGPMTLDGGSPDFRSVPVRVPTRENRDATKSQERERNSKSKRPVRNPKGGSTAPIDEDDEEDGIEEDTPDPEELEAGHFRQQDFPQAAARARLSKLFVEIFPHADYVILRLDSDPSYVGHFRQMVGARARISSLNKGIRAQQNLAAKARANADGHMYAANNANSQGDRGNALASAQRALQDAQRAETQAKQLSLQIPRWEKVVKEAESHYTRIKEAMSAISGGAINGTMYRVVDGIQVDVVRMGNVAGDDFPANDSTAPESNPPP